MNMNSHISANSLFVATISRWWIFVARPVSIVAIVARPMSIVAIVARPMSIVAIVARRWIVSGLPATIWRWWLQVTVVSQWPNLHQLATVATDLHALEPSAVRRRRIALVTAFVLVPLFCLANSAAHGGDQKPFVDLELQWVRLEGNQLIGQYVEPHNWMEYRFRTGGYNDPIAAERGPLLGDVMRWSVPLESIEIRSGTGKRISSVDYRQIYQDAWIPVIIVDDLELLFREFQTHLATDAVIMKKPSVQPSMVESDVDLLTIAAKVPLQSDPPKVVRFNCTVAVPPLMKEVSDTPETRKVLVVKSETFPVGQSVQTGSLPAENSIPRYLVQSFLQAQVKTINHFGVIYQATSPEFQYSEQASITETRENADGTLGTETVWVTETRTRDFSEVPRFVTNMIMWRFTADESSRNLFIYSALTLPDSFKQLFDPRVYRLSGEYPRHLNYLQDVLKSHKIPWAKIAEAYCFEDGAFLKSATKDSKDWLRIAGRKSTKLTEIYRDETQIGLEVLGRKSRIRIPVHAGMAESRMSSGQWRPLIEVVRINRDVLEQNPFRE